MSPLSLCTAVITILFCVHNLFAGSDSLSDVELLSSLRKYDAQRIKISDSGFRLNRSALSVCNNSGWNKRFLEEYKSAKTQKAIGVSTALSPFALAFIPVDHSFLLSVRYPLYGLGIGLACGGHKKETRAFIEHERAVRQRYQFNEALLKRETTNDTLSHYLSYLDKTLRISPFATKKGAFSTAALLNSAPIRLGSYSAITAKYAAKGINSEAAVEIFDRADKHRRGSRACLIGGSIATGVIASAMVIYLFESIFSDEDNSDEFAALFVAGSVSWSVIGLSIPLRISSERKFDRGLLQYERDLKKKYYLVH